MLYLPYFRKDDRTITRVLATDMVFGLWTCERVRSAHVAFPQVHGAVSALRVRPSGSRPKKKAPESTGDVYGIEEADYACVCEFLCLCLISIISEGRKIAATVVDDDEWSKLI